MERERGNLARKEAQTDLRDAEQLKGLGIEVYPQGSAVPDIDAVERQKAVDMLCWAEADGNAEAEGSAH